jgi:peroxiredoxin Q/BCP
MAVFVITLLVGLPCMPLAVHALDVGDKAPLFEAPSSKGTIRLADYQGVKNVVLAFYFAAFSPV